jgi:hypothetical protein
MRWEEYVARMGNRRGAYRVLVVRPEGKNHLEDLDLNGRIILKCILKK